MLPTLGEIIELILLDESAIEGLPDTMKERAHYARDALRDPTGYTIEFGRYNGEAYTFAIWHDDHNRWYDITGHYHTKSPKRTIREREYYSQSNPKICGKRIEDRLWRKIIIPQLDEGVCSLSEQYSKRRSTFPKICNYCGKEQTTKKFHWHHLDHTLRLKIKDTDPMFRINPITHPIKYEKAMEQHLRALLAYSNVPVEETVLLCPKCHRREHIRLNENSK